MNRAERSDSDCQLFVIIGEHAFHLGTKFLFLQGAKACLAVIGIRDGENHCGFTYIENLI